MYKISTDYFSKNTIITVTINFDPRDYHFHFKNVAFRQFTEITAWSQIQLKFCSILFMRTIHFEIVRYCGGLILTIFFNFPHHHRANRPCRTAQMTSRIEFLCTRRLHGSLLLLIHSFYLWELLIWEVLDDQK